MTRYCPKCGEAVPTNSITCPKCYTKMPPETAKWEDSGQNYGGKSKDRTLVMLLTIVPGFFGLLGLGRVYQEPKSQIGYKYLILGLILFLLGNVLLFLPAVEFFTAAIKTLLGIILLLLYIGLFLLSILDSLLNIHLFIR